MEANALVDGPPKPVKEGIKPEEVEELSKKLDCAVPPIELK